MTEQLTTVVIWGVFPTQIHRLEMTFNTEGVLPVSEWEKYHDEDNNIWYENIQLEVLPSGEYVMTEGRAVFPDGEVEKVMQFEELPLVYDGELFQTYQRDETGQLILMDEVASPYITEEADLPFEDLLD